MVEFATRGLRPDARDPGHLTSGFVMEVGLTNKSLRGPFMPSARSIVHGLILAAVLSLLFLLLSAYQTAATLASRVAKTDVMAAAMEGVMSGRVVLEVAWFFGALVVLHLAMGLLAWLLALASGVLWPRVREKFPRYVVGWFALLALATVSFSALWHPRTLLGAYYHDSISRAIMGYPLGRWMYLAVILFAIAVTLGAAWRVARATAVTLRMRVAAVVFATAIVITGFLSVFPGEPAAAIAVESKQPHVILIGIDSLRLDQVRRYGGRGLTPRLDEFIESADLFKDATTPLARTFPSWTSILTGRSPIETRARFNLSSRKRVQSYPTIADVLRQSGYQTIFAMDEVRFANIDETYGFDKLVSPRMGAPDFILGTYNELPLSSVVINTRLGKWIFPYSYSNRGAATMYQPETFLGRLEREVSFDQPTLLIAHLTGAHWPYYTAGTPFGISMWDDGGLSRPLYEESLRTVDSMFGRLVEILERQGALSNAIVVVLSDHGEALSLPADTFFADGAIVEGMRTPMKMLDLGHGQSVLSPTQYHVMLGFRAFGTSQQFDARGRDFQYPVTVEDISPTILDLLGMDPAKLSPTGRSLAAVLRAGNVGEEAGLASDRIRFTETDLRVLPAQNGFDEDATAAENSKYFEIEPENGRMSIRENMAPLAIAFKERAAFTQTSLLAAMPAGPEAMQFLYFDLAAGRGRILSAPPAVDEPEVKRLWDAMHDHYGTEMKPLVVVTRDDLPGFGEAWANYLKSLQSGRSKPSGT